MATKVFQSNGAVQNYTLAVPSDTVDLDLLARGVILDVAGAITLVKSDGSTATFNNLVAGVQYNLPHKRINSTGTGGAVVAWHIF